MGVPETDTRKSGKNTPSHTECSDSSVRSKGCYSRSLESTHCGHLPLLGIEALLGSKI